MPQTSEQIIRSLVEARIQTEKANLAKQKIERGRVYLPKESYEVNETILFSALNWQSGKVTSIRQLLILNCLLSK